MAIQTIYARSSNSIKELLGQSISPLTIHRHVQKYSKNIKCESQTNEAKTLMFDETKVPAGFNGKNSLLGLSLDDRYQEYGRNKIKKSVICFDIDKSWSDLEGSLKKYNPDFVITDGDLAIKAMVKECFSNSKIQQCIWHLIHTTKYYLWADKYPRCDRIPLINELIKIVKKENQVGLKNFVDKLNSLKLKKTAQFIESGLDDFLTYTNSPVLYKATSPIEREMREINRRVDVGARWTTKGIYNLLNLKLAYEKNKTIWNEYWYTPNQQLAYNIQVC